jgi:heat shock protein HslJ
VRADALAGVPWQVTSGIHTPGWEAVAPTMSFAHGRLSGFNGCNRYTTSYTLDGDQLTIKPPAATTMACAEPGSAVEPEFMGKLAEARQIKLDGETLILLDAGGRTLLRLRPATLHGSWEAISFLTATAVSSTILGTTITATFAPDGTLSGSAGCNSYHATYKADHGKLTIGEPTSTHKACSDPAGVMEQEHAYLLALPQAKAYTVEGDKLSLLTSKGTFVATYTRAG